jgi:rSAM/selenodomain-associated transferase 2
MVSVVIPTWNEAAGIGGLVSYLYAQGKAGELEVIVADGGSTDDTCLLAEGAGAQVMHCTRKGRAPQLNAGATFAKGNILYFLHADTYPPPGFQEQLEQAVHKGSGSGCYRLQFDEPHWFLRGNAWFTRYDIDAVRFGDQSLFVQREVFFRAGGFAEEYLLLEDQEIISRLKQLAPFVVLPACVTTSARKYREHGVYRLQLCYYLIYTLYRLKLSQKYLARFYQWLLRKQ